MSDARLCLEFATLFRGRLDAYGTDDGGCDKRTTGTWNEYTNRVAAHLFDDTPMGVYPLLDDSTVYWGCVDFDEGEEASFTHARNVVNVTAEFNLLGQIERSRSKGYHVWLFFREPQDALTVRRALLAACQIAGAPTKEINPKQTVVVDRQVGNYVRLPYPCGATVRQVMVDWEGYPYTLEDWWHDEVVYSPADQLDELAALYRPPTVAARPVHRADLHDIDDIMLRVSPKTRRMITNPIAGEDVDRSRQLFVIARRLADEQMLTRTEIEQVVRHADQWLGKYTDRHDADLRYAEVVAKVVG